MAGTSARTAGVRSRLGLSEAFLLYHLDISWGGASMQPEPFTTLHINASLCWILGVICHVFKPLLPNFSRCYHHPGESTGPQDCVIFNTTCPILARLFRLTNLVAATAHQCLHGSSIVLDVPDCPQTQGPNKTSVAR